MSQRQTPHAMLPKIEHDENARQDFVFSFRQHLAREVNPGTTVAYEKRVEPKFVKEHGRKPADHDEVRKCPASAPMELIRVIA
jgi:hypothetical protein